MRSFFHAVRLLLQVLLTAALLSAASAARTKRQRPGDDDKQVIVNIENEEKTQYHEQNFNSSKEACRNIESALLQLIKPR
jgi:hypothetical protein